MQFKDIVPSLLLTAQAHAATIQPRADSLKVRAITFNIRYAADEPDRYKDEKPWDDRKVFVLDLLKTSAEGAARNCNDKLACGVQWYTDEFDGQSDFGTQLSALEVVQSLLVKLAPELGTASS